MASLESYSTLPQADIRQQLKRMRADLDPSYRQQASRAIADKVVRSNWFYGAKKIGCYLATHVEVDTSTIISRAWRMKKRVFVPVVRENLSLQFHEIEPDTELYQTGFGLYEPLNDDVIPVRELDIVITPLVAFDLAMNRIGMGGGCFDRTFAFLKDRQFYLRPKLIGVAFACQQIEKVNANPWDIRLFQIITDSS